MGQFSGTRDDEVAMYRCGSKDHPGCGKILTEGQVSDHSGCPRCGSPYISDYSPRGKIALLMCYLRLLVRGELWVRS